jgi:hypothetical protein
MFSRTLTLAAAVVAISTFAYAQTSSNPSMQPNPGGDPKAETAGTKAKATKTKGAKKTPAAQDTSSTPSMAPTPGAGTTGKIEAENKGAKVKGAKKTPKAGETSSTPAMAPAK